MLQELKTSKKVVGIKQLRKALREGTVIRVFVADNADPRLTAPVEETCAANEIPLERVPTMAQLGIACSIEVGAAVAAIVR